MDYLLNGNKKEEIPTITVNVQGHSDKKEFTGKIKRMSVYREYLERLKKEEK